MACEALGVLLRKAVQTASSRGVSNPFSAEIGILDDDQLDDEVIQRAYQGAPITFFQETWHSVVAIVADNLHRDGVSKPPYRDDIWPHRHSQYIHRLQEKLLRGLDASAQQVPRGIRAHFCYALTPLFGTPFQQQVKDLFRPMWLLDPWLPVDRLVEQFLNFALRLEYEKFGEIMEALLEGEDPQSRVVAARQATITALVVPEARDVTARLILGDEHIRKGMAEVCAANVRFGKFRDDCTGYLMALFSDPDPDVRGAASGCFGDLAGDDLAGLWDLETAFLDSLSAEAHLRSLLGSLARSTVRHDEITLRACRQAVEQANRGKDSSYLELELCPDLALRPYHQASDATTRERSLDLIDQLLGLDVDGLEGALQEIEARR